MSSPNTELLRPTLGTTWVFHYWGGPSPHPPAPRVVVSRPTSTPVRPSVVPGPTRSSTRTSTRRTTPACRRSRRPRGTRRVTGHGRSVCTGTTPSGSRRRAGSLPSGPLPVLSRQWTRGWTTTLHDPPEYHITGVRGRPPTSGWTGNRGVVRTSTRDYGRDLLSRLDGWSRCRRDGPLFTQGGPGYRWSRDGRPFKST